MNLDKLRGFLNQLTPQQKIEFLNKELKKEHTEKDKKQILFFIEVAKKEQQVIEEELAKRETQLTKETLSKLEKVTKTESEETKPLENIVQEQSIERQNDNRQQQLMRLYGREDLKVQNVYGTQTNKPTDLYNQDNINQQRKEQGTDYILATEDRFTQQREQSFIRDEAERLKKERTKYESGKA